jgi:PDZ domain-containing secreted protein
MKMTKLTRLLMSLLLVGCLITTGALAQTKVKTKVAGGGDKSVTFSADDAMLLAGVGAVVMAEGDSLKIVSVAPAGSRDQDFRKVDLKAGDILMMVSSRPVKTIAALRELIDKLEVGATIKFGIKRSDGYVMTSMPKVDDQQSGGMVTKVVGGGEPGEGGKSGHTMMKTMVIGGNGNDQGMVPLMGLGKILVESDGKLIIGPPMQIQGMKVPESNLEPDDIVLAINDSEVSTAAEFEPIYDAIASGDQVTLKVKRGDETFTVVFAKPDMSGVKMIRMGGH